LAITPVLYVIVKSWSLRRRGGGDGRTYRLEPAQEPPVPV